MTTLSTNVDQYFTPDDLARRVVQLVTVDSRASRAPPIIADFAAGEGNLLIAAARRWPDAKFVATDLDPRVVAHLRRERRDWTVGRCDFLRGTSRARCAALSPLKNTTDLILLNPPFTCRGGTHHTVALDGEQVQCGTAAAFLLNALPFLALNGQILAVLPASFLTSHRDEAARTYLGRFGRLELVARCGRNTFDLCFPHTVVIRFTKSTANHLAKNTLNSSMRRGRDGLGITYSSAATTAFGSPMKVHTRSLQAQTDLNLHVRLVRGVVQVHTLSRASGPPRRFVHTTELKAGNIRPRLSPTPKRARAVSGPSVLLPRVGEPRVDKIVLYQGRQDLILSDCVFGLQCSGRREAEVLHALMCTHWVELASAYGGTGAKYITVAALQRFLNMHGVHVTIEAPVTHRGSHVMSMTRSPKPTRLAAPSATLGVAHG
jgi:hypothetical protein